MQLRKRQHTVRKVAAGSVIAGIGGYLAGILTAPKSGQQTRHELAEKAGEAKSEAEIQLQIAHRELDEVVKKAKASTVALGAKAREEFDEALAKARDAQDKAAHVLKALKAGQAEDPELNKAIKQARQATKNLSKYLKS